MARARHIEIQVFGHGDGTAVHLFERECSVQRRFQKIIEESPAPNLPQALREQMTAAAVALAAHQSYRGPGTVEFIVDADTMEFFFLEMNTRIQVEHPVTEMVTGLDLVQAQIQLAAGNYQRVAQADIKTQGAAIECRIYAENPAKNFMPSPGPLQTFRLPLDMAHVRIDTGVREGDRITPYYDPMIAKLIVWGEDRAEALERMGTALAASQHRRRAQQPELSRRRGGPPRLQGRPGRHHLDRARTRSLARGHAMTGPNPTRIIAAHRRGGRPLHAGRAWAKPSTRTPVSASLALCAA